MALTKEDVISVLRTCQDPEIPVNIVDLGLVYEISLTDTATPVAHDVTVRMTLTSPGCPMSNSISNEVHKKLLELPSVRTAKVDIVWEPAWHPGLITPSGRQHLNLT
jgi:metal-sulfur cluster biosynthetic enzyme